MPADDAITVCMQALYDAADDDSATGGPDLTRHIYPVVAVITADGFRRLTDEEAGTYAQAIVDERMQLTRRAHRAAAAASSETASA